MHTRPIMRSLIQHRKRGRTTLALLAATAAVAASAASADAATPTCPATSTCFPVISAADKGSGTLRDAINAVNKDKSDPTTNTDVIQFKIGTGTGVHTIKLASALPVITRSGVQIDGYTQQPGAAPATDIATAKLKIVLDAANVDEGLEISADNVKVSGLDIQNAQRDGVLAYGTGDVIAGNYIGTDVTGSAPRPGPFGVTLDNSANVVGGPAPEDRNVISSNGTEVLLEGAGGHTVQGNRIGTDAAGKSSLADPNGDGVYVDLGVGNQIRDNLISGEDNGILLANSNDNTVQHNNVGTDVTGTTALPNSTGINVGGTGNLIGGTDATEGNLVSGNTFEGVRLNPPATDNDVKGNQIGANEAGDKALPNGTGVYVNDADSNTIGGTGDGAGNVIAGNTRDGVELGSADDNVVRGNQIGTDRAGTLRLGNGSNGVNIADGNDNQIGGTSAGAANTIAYNADDGVTVTSSDGGTSGVGNAIVHNSIHDNDDLTHKKVNVDDLGIDLGADGGTPNDPPGFLDADTGANGLQNHPVIDSAKVKSGKIKWHLDSESNQTYRLDFYANTSCDPSGSGEGETYLGSQTETTTVDGHWDDTFTPATPLAAGQVVTMTATEQLASGKLRSTSEFSPCETVS